MDNSSQIGLIEYFLVPFKITFFRFTIQLKLVVSSLKQILKQRIFLFLIINFSRLKAFQFSSQQTNNKTNKWIQERRECRPRSKETLNCQVNHGLCSISLSHDAVLPCSGNRRVPPCPTATL